MLGAGWALGGLSYITRCPKSYAQDGDPEPIKYTDPAELMDLDDSSDALCLDGVRLKKTGPAGTNCETEFRKEIGGDVRIVSRGCGDAEARRPEHFEVYREDGTTWRYGYDAPGVQSNSRLGAIRSTYTYSDSAPTHSASVKESVVYAWALSEIVDRAQNYLRVTYKINTTLDDGTPLVDENGDPAFEQVPTRIDYTGNYRAKTVSGGTVAPLRSVVFTTEDNGDHRIRHIGGIALATVHRISKIVMNGPGVVGGQAASTQPEAAVSELRSYSLAYQKSASTGRALLSNVTECAGSLCRKPVEFDWGCESSKAGCPAVDASSRWVEAKPLGFKVNSDYSDVAGATFQNAPDLWALRDPLVWVLQSLQYSN